VCELFEQAAELSGQVSELIDHQPRAVSREVKVCQKDVRCSSKKIGVFFLREVCPLEFQASKQSALRLWRSRSGGT
jgi:hydroxymethylpyrimidine/phosphomethylpyrimidine kinase